MSYFTILSPGSESDCYSMLSALKIRIIETNDWNYTL